MNYKLIVLAIAWLCVTGYLLERDWLAEKEIQEMVERNYHIVELLNERIDDANRKIDIAYEELRNAERAQLIRGVPESMVQ